MGTISYTGTLVIEECCNCHMKFAMPADYQRQVKETGQNFHCPQGHRQHYTTSEVQKLARQLENAQAEIAREKANAKWYADRAETALSQAKISEHRRRAAVGQVTKIKNRIHNGVCPCCNRHFQNLEAHIKREHPDFVEAPNA